MIYNVTSSFTRITETAGTIQNNSYIYPIEVSNQAVADSGILLYPLNKFSFSGTQLYLRCINTLDGKKFGDAEIKDGKLNFFANVGDTTAIKSIDLPAELFLDQVHTTFVGNFNFAGGGYTNATNPNLDGKPVLVIAVKDNAASPNVTYSFLNMEALVDTYAPLNNGISISGYSIGARISGDADNQLSIAADGLFVGHDDDKVDKVPSVTQGNIAIFGADGAIADSGSKFATDAEVAELINQYFPTTAGGNG